MSIEFGVLGPLRVVRDGLDVDGLSAKQRLLLAALLVRVNEVVSVDSLVDALWGDRPPATAVAVVQTYVSQIRKALAGGGARGSSAHVVVTVDPGYRLVLERGQLDASRFEDLLAAGRASLRGGRAAVAGRQLRDGLALWRGPALADVADAAPMRVEANRLDALRLVAVEERFEADIALGRHDELVPELEALVGAHPLREHLWGQLMLCLYRGGRQADALAAGRRLRERLRDELGLDPGPDVVRLERDILGHAPNLQWSGPPVGGRDTGSSPSGSGVSHLPLWAGSELFVGRVAELDILDRWWHDGASPERLAVVVGESGIGKSRLATVFARRLESSGVSVLYGRALQSGGSAYEPILGALRQFVVDAADDALDKISDTVLGAVCRVVPEMAQRRPELAAQAVGWGHVDRSWLLSTVGNCFDRDGRVLLVLDDVQWAHRPALLLMSHLLVQDKPVRILATFRQPDRARSRGFADFLADLRRDGRPVRRITLGGLSDGDVACLLAPSAGGQVQVNDVAIALRRRTDGHPLFVRECLLQLRAISGRGDVSTAQLDRLGVPEGVKEMVGQRLSQLTPATEHVLRSAAVVGVEFDLGVVAATVRGPETDVLTAIEEALGAGVVWEDHDHIDRYGFHHVLVHEVLLDELTVSRRARLEWSVGEALQALHENDVDEYAADIARHYMRGIAVGDAARAAAWTRRAGDRAAESLAHEDALRFYEWALDALTMSNPTDHTVRIDVLIVLARAADRAGDRLKCRAACDEAAALSRRVGDARRLAGAAINLLGTLGPGNDPSVITLIGEAADALRRSGSEQADNSLLAELLARTSGYLVTIDAAASARMAEEALRTARQAGDDRTLALALMSSTQSYALGRADLEARLGEASDLAANCGDPELALAVHSNLMRAALTWADRDRYDEHLAAYARIAADMRAPLPRLLSAIDRAGATALDGHYRTAAAELVTVMQHAKMFDDPFLPENILAVHAVVDRELGLLDREEQFTRRSMTDDIRNMPLLTHILCQRGDYEQARIHFDTAMAHSEILLAGFHRQFVLAMFAETARALHDANGASQLFEPLHAQLRYGPCVVLGPNAFHGAINRYLGLLADTIGDVTAAVEHHAAGLEIHRQMRAPGWTARSQYDLAATLLHRREHGDQREAAGLLADARAAARDLDMPTLLEQIQSLDAPRRTSGM